MLPGQFEAGLRVIKTRIIETDQLEFPSVMVAVALYAFLAPDLVGSMVAFFCLYPPGQGLMAFQAFVPRNLLP